jgi:signal transduction histidine kinase
VGPSDGVGMAAPRLLRPGDAEPSVWAGWRSWGSGLARKARAEPAATAVLLGGTAFAAFLLSWLVLGWGGHETTAWASNLLQPFAMLLAAVCAAYAAYRTQGRDRLGLGLTSAMAGCWFMAQALYIAVGLGVAASWVSELSNLLFLSGTPLLVASILLLLGQDLSRAALARRMLDAVIVVGSLVVVSYIYILRHSLRLPGLDSIGMAYTYVYPIGDAVAAGLILTLFPLLPRARRRMAAAWVAGWGLLIVADSLYALDFSRGLYTPAALYNAVWVMAEVMIAFAALRWARVAPSRSDAAGLSHYARFPLVAPVAAMILLGADFWMNHEAWRAHFPTIPILLVLGVFFAVIGRHWFYGVEFRMQAQRVIEVENARQRDMAEAREQAIRHEHELEMARKQNALKTHLLNTASHELNTPISALKLQLHLHRDQLGPRATPEDRKSLELLDRNVKRLAGLITDTLDVSRIQSGSFKIKPKAVDLAELAREVVEQVSPLAAKDQVRVELERSGPAWCEGDPARLTQVVYNLVGNALKYAPPGSQVRVAVQAADGQVACSVQDQGIGMTPEQMQKLFQPFSQVQEEADQRGGAGLGLFISRAIMDQHGGSLTCASPGKGKGSTFTFRLPVGQPVVPAAPAVAATAATATVRPAAA